MSLPNVAVLILNYKGLDLTRRCIRSVKGLVYPRFETVVVDNGSEDGSAELLRSEFPEVVVLALDENLGYSGGNNRGIEWSDAQGRFDAVLVLNNDVVVDPGLLDRLVPHMEEGCIVAPQIRSIERPEAPAGLVGDFDWRRGVVRNGFGKQALDVERADSVGVEFVAGCCLLVPMEVFRRVGAFDDEFFLYYEDADFLVRARRAGVRIVYEPRALLFHDESASVGTGALRVYYSTRNRLYFMKKHCSGRGFALFLGYFIAGRIVYALRYLATGEWRNLRAMTLGITDFWRNRMGRAAHRW